jgi:aryl-alcohol dehydrogenase-like predicted oxidoreductase
MAAAFGLSVVPWGVLGGGVLSGKYKSTKELPPGTRYGIDEKWGALFVTDRNIRIAEAAGAVAREIGRSTSQVALAWARQQRPAGAIVPILGAKTVAQVKDNLGCLEFSLEEKQLAALDEASRIDMGFPHDFLLRARQYVYGKTFPLTDDRR